MAITTTNCTLTSITIGTGAHDGRAFASFGVTGNGWGQGGTLPWDRASIDTLIRVCGAKDLLDCTNKVIRIRLENELIKSLVHIIDDGIYLDVR